MPALLTAIGAVAGNIFANTLEVAFHLSSPERLIVHGSIYASVVLLAVLLEGGFKIPGYFAYHRFSYLADMQGSDVLRQWVRRFASLQLGPGPRYVAAAEVMEGGARRDLVEVLTKQLVRKKKGSHVLVLGEPGSGKSTALERLTFDLARRSFTKLGFGPVPILIRAGAERSDYSLTSLVSEAINEWAQGKTRKLLSDPDSIQKLIEQGSMVLLVDALDELTGAKRGALVSTLSSLATSGALEHISVVVTCRTRQDPHHALADYETYTLLELSEESVAAFINIYGEGTQAALQATYTRLWESGFLDPGGLGRNPFWLKQLIGIGTLERTRSGILREATRESLARELSKPQTALRDWTRPAHATDAQIIELCVRTLNRVAKVLDLSRTIPRNQLRGSLSDWLEDPLGAPVNIGLSADHLLHLTEDAGLLSRSFDPVSFGHRLLQEYFTASALQGEYSSAGAWLGRYVTDTTRWQTLALLAGLVSPARRDQLVDGILLDSAGPRNVACAIAAFVADNRVPEGPLSLRLLEEIKRGLSGEKPTDADLVASLQEFLAMGHDLAAAFLGSLLADADERVRARVCELLALSTSREAARLLAGAGLEDASETVASAASKALTSCGEFGLWQAIASLESRKPEVRRRAARTLAEIGDPCALNYLLRMDADDAESQSPSDKYDYDHDSYYASENDSDQNTEDATVCDAIVACGRHRLGRLLLALVFGSARQKVRVLKALGQIRDPKAQPPIVRSLADSEEDVREAALECLKATASEDKQATPTIVTALRHQLLGLSETHSSWAAKTLASLGTEGMQALIEAVNSSAAAEGALQKVVESELIQYLVDHLDAYDAQTTEQLMKILAANESKNVDSVLIEAASAASPQRRPTIVRCIAAREEATGGRMRLRRYGGLPWSPWRNLDLLSVDPTQAETFTGGLTQHGSASPT